MLVNKAGRPGDVIDEDQPLESDSPYRSSKVKAERVTRRVPIEGNITRLGSLLVRLAEKRRRATIS